MRIVALAAGPIIFALTFVVPAPAALPTEGWRVMGIAGLMAVWWLTAVIPLEATALLPIVLLPLLGVAPIGDVTRSYADPIIFLFLGGFFLAATLERWNLHKRFALATVRIAGTDGPRVILAFILASAALSMWISNTATAVMMLPIAKAVAGGMDAPFPTTSPGGQAGGPFETRRSRDAPQGRRAGGLSPHPSGVGDHTNAATGQGFPVALMLAIAYGCSIGGVATLVGTPPNAIFAGAARELLDVDVSFGGWMLTGLSVTLPMLLLCWLLLLRLYRVRGHVPGLDAAVARESARMARLAGAERFILGVFAVTAASWIFRAPKTIGGVRIPGLSDILPGISDAGIAIAAALVLFVVPLRRSRFPAALNWEAASKVPWGILLLFGGGLALASAFAQSGLTEWIGGRLEALRGAPFPVVILATTGLFVFLTELTSNTATSALGMPLIAGVALGLGVPALPLMAAVALAASMAFMLPVATPPNAIVFGSGALRPVHMAKAGIWLNFLAIVVITLVVWVWLV
jgi:sodium-dependent dicarboxylate transporter 2/3/5